MNEPIRCLANATEIEWPHLHDPYLSALVLAGKVKPQPSGAVVWWLDENLKEHTIFIEFPASQPRPSFTVVQKQGVEVSVEGVGRYTVTRTR